MAKPPALAKRGEKCPTDFKPVRSARTGTADVVQAVGGQVGGWRPGQVTLATVVATRRDEVMEKTKTGKDQRLGLPEAMMAVLRRHVEEYCKPGTPEGDSDLLFPSATGGFLAASVLDKPFDVVAKAIGVTYPLTPRAMRRTFKDLSRLAGLQKIVEGSISGHVTEAMAVRYSTVRPEEQRAALDKVVSLAYAKVGAKVGAETETGPEVSLGARRWAIVGSNHRLPPCEEKNPVGENIFSDETVQQRERE